MDISFPYLKQFHIQTSIKEFDIWLSDTLSYRKNQETEAKKSGIFLSSRMIGEPLYASTQDLTVHSIMIRYNLSSDDSDKVDKDEYIYFGYMCLEKSVYVQIKYSSLRLEDLITRLCLAIEASFPIIQAAPLNSGLPEYILNSDDDNLSAIASLPSPTKKRGRKGKFGYDSAFLKIHEEYMTIREAYEWWKVNFPDEVNNEIWARPYNSFNYAMNYRMNNLQKNTEK